MSRNLTRGLFASCLLPLLLSACAEPKQDDFRSQGGISPDPTGQIQGTVLYKGPRPACAWNGTRRTRVIGRVVLTLFDFDNPPPPAGRATSAKNILFLNAEDVFTLDDCRDKDATIEDSGTVARVADFTWPEIPLAKVGREYQIRGFYDADENMDPFFGVTNLPTAGDVAGGALANLDDPLQGFRRVALPPVHDARDGFIRRGIIVALGNVVRSERPMFKLSDERFLSAEATIEVVIDPSKLPECLDDTSTCVNRAETLRRVRALTCAEGATKGECGFEVQALREDDVASAFAAAGLHPDFSPEHYAFFAEPVDVLTVQKGAEDTRLGDGIPDPHPLLGASANVPWYSPALIMRRAAPTDAQAKIERAAGIPQVLMIGSALLANSGSATEKRVYSDAVPMAVPPVAAVELDANRVDCRLPYVPPGNFTNTYEARIAYCAELPTGIYGVNVLAGVSAGRRTAADASVSDTGYVWEGAATSGQAWSLPNELGNPAQVGKGNTLEDQSAARLFVVHDPHPDDIGDCSVAVDPSAALLNPKVAPRAVVPNGLCDGDAAPLNETVSGIDGPKCLPTGCCDSVRHLCDVPLCAFCTEASCPGLGLSDLNVRSGPTTIVRTTEDGHSVPDCVPFEIPTLCCP